MVGLVGCSGQGCERGCLTRWAVDRGVGQAGHAAGPGALDAGLSFTGIDCVAGVSRCRGGTVEVSGAGQIAAGCRGERCSCPWRPLGTCTGACVAEDVEIALDEEVALSQLCVRDDAGVSAIAPVALLEGREGCVDDEVRCSRGSVVRCGRASHFVVVCTYGCATEGADVDGEVDDLRAVRILCKTP